MAGLADATGNINKPKINVSEVLEQTRTKFENIIGGVTESWQGDDPYGVGFAGMSESGVEDFKAALKDYCEKCKIDSMNFGNMEVPIQGAAKDAFLEFSQHCKDLFNAYIGVIMQEADEIDAAYQNFKTATESIAKDVTSQSSEIDSAVNEIRSNSGSIKLD